MSISPVSHTNAEFRLLPLGAIVESKTNPRKRYDAERMADLVRSAKLYGILEPIICRPKGERFEIVAGSRRFRAAKESGLSEIKAIISTYTDAQVAEVQLIENGQREDVNPIEEAEGIERWMALARGTAEVCAEKIGKDISHVRRRLQLLKLTDSLRELVYTEAITVTHALLLARLRPEDQVYAEKEGLFENTWDQEKLRYEPNGQAVTVRELASWINQHILLVLQGVPWGLDDPLLSPAAGSCMACQKRTGAQAALFVDLDGKDRCLDRPCFEAKRLAYLKSEESKTPGLVRCVEGWCHDKAEAKRYGVKDGSSSVYREAKPGCKKPEQAIVAIGDKFGQRRTVCRDPKCKHHGYSTPRPKTDSAARKTEELIRATVDHAVAALALTPSKTNLVKITVSKDDLAMVIGLRYIESGLKIAFATDVGAKTFESISLPKTAPDALWRLLCASSALDGISHEAERAFFKARGCPDRNKFEKQIEDAARAEIAKPFQEAIGRDIAKKTAAKKKGAKR